MKKTHLYEWLTLTENYPNSVYYRNKVITCLLVLDRQGEMNEALLIHSLSAIGCKGKMWRDVKFAYNLFHSYASNEQENSHASAVG
jgi:hypothetical protein